MDSPRRRWRVLAVLVLLLDAGATRARADLIPGTGGGGHLILRDTASHLDWLNLTETANRSYADVIAETGSGGLFEGWQYAQVSQISELFSHASIPVGSPHQVRVSTDLLLSEWGTLYAEGTIKSSYVITGTPAGFSPQNEPQSYVAWVYSDSSNEASSGATPQAGTYVETYMAPVFGSGLVRPPVPDFVPEPDAITQSETALATLAAFLLLSRHARGERVNRARRTHVATVLVEARETSS